MPSHKIHLAIAKKINEKLNVDLDSLMLGSILPDICEESDHQIAHFQHGEKDLEGLARPDEFINKYKEKLKNPVMLGYLVHLLTDKYYNEYMFKNFYIYDKNDNGIGMILKGKKKYINGSERKKLKHREFNIYDKWLLNHNYVSKFKDYKCIENVNNIEEASFYYEKIKKYIESANEDVDKINFFSKLYFYNYKITNKKELDGIFDGCISYIVNYIKNI